MTPTDEQCNALLESLHEYAKSQDIYCGLPLWTEAEISKQVSIVRTWMAGVSNGAP